MIGMIQPLPVGNALRLFVQPPIGAVRWKVLANSVDEFSGHDDPLARLVFEGQNRVVIDTTALRNDQMVFYRPFYTADGVTWNAGASAYGTPAATFTDHTTDVQSFVRERLEAGLLVEVERGTFATDLGYIQVYTAPPSLEQNLSFPLVTVHLESEGPSERALGEDTAGDAFDAIGFEYEETEGWLASVQVTIIGWSLNSDERLALRQAIRRVIIANLPVFSGEGFDQVDFTQQDIDAVSGEFGAPMYQVMSTFSCLAPVRVGGLVSAIRDVSLTVRTANG